MAGISDNTIVAITTALGEGAVGIVRLSGGEALTVANRIMQKPLKGEHRKMEYNHVVDGVETVDEVLAVYMRSPHSYTAEDVVEIQCHGGVAALQKVLALCLAKGAKLAEPGEFTKRAFLNGRIDLTQAEAVMDIIHARSEAALTAALRAQQGELSAKIRTLRTQLLDLVVQLEAKIDYPEDDIEDTTYEFIQTQLGEVRQGVEGLLASGHTGKILREGLPVAILGRPNVGKSSLLNALLEEERAIVSDFAGTTRDVIEEQTLIGGVPVVLSDTAGIRSTDDYVEKIGVERSLAVRDRAQLILCVLDGSSPLTAEDRGLLAELTKAKTIVVLNKIDLPQMADSQALNDFQVVPVSSKTGEGIDKLKDLLREYAYGGNSSDNGLFVQNVRHMELLRTAKEAVTTALTTAQDRLPYDCVTVDVQNAVSALGEITGDAVSDEVINKIFEKFCVGK